MAVVNVRMNTCDRSMRIEVIRRDDGDLDVRIDSDCENVRMYASKLTRMTEMDVIDFSDSIVNRRGVRDPLTPTCLCPMGVVYAASMELGMLTERLARKAVRDCSSPTNDFLQFKNRQAITVFRFS